jgi:hypothetical protein
MIRYCSCPADQGIDGSGLREVFAEQPDLPRVWIQAVQVEAQKANESQPVPDLEFILLIGQPVERLQDQNLEHQYRI